MNGALRPLVLAAMAAAAGAGECRAQELVVHGNFKRVIHTGDTAGVVALDTLKAPNSWGVGATAGLKGEIVVVDGKVLVSRGSDPGARTAPPQPGEQAVFLAHGAAGKWDSIALPQDMDAAQFRAFVEMHGAQRQLDFARGFSLRVKGAFPRLVWHVVTGAPPGHEAGGNAAAAGGHANNRSGFNLYEEDGARGEIVGVYAGAENEGKASHPGEMLHLHFIGAEGTRSGHVDEISFATGTELLLPNVSK